MTRKEFKGKLITFEGGEGCGKSTQIKLLKQRLNDLKIPNTITREPGGTLLAEEIRKILLSESSKELSSLAELFLFEASRAQHFAELIQPKLTEGQIILSDRYFDSSTVYQGMARDLGQDLVQSLNQIATQNHSPDLTFVLDIDPNISLARSQDRLQQEEVDEGRFEAEDIQFHKDVRNGFLKLANENTERFVVIDAHKSIVEVEKNILNALSEHPATKEIDWMKA